MYTSKKGKFFCLFCSFSCEDEKEIQAHVKENHEFVLIPFTQEELLKLVSFFRTGDARLISPLVFKRLQRYLNNFHKKEKMRFEE